MKNLDEVLRIELRDAKIRSADILPHKSHDQLISDIELTTSEVQVLRFAITGIEMAAAFNSHLNQPKEFELQATTLANWFAKIEKQLPSAQAIFTAEVASYIRSFGTTERVSAHDTVIRAAIELSALWKSAVQLTQQAVEANVRPLLDRTWSGLLSECSAICRLGIHDVELATERDRAVAAVVTRRQQPVTGHFDILTDGQKKASRQGSMQASNIIPESWLEESRTVYRNDPMTKKTTLQSKIRIKFGRCASDDAQALMETMRTEGLCKVPTRKPRKRSNRTGS